MKGLYKRKLLLAVLAVLFAAAGITAAIKLMWREDAREFYFRAESNQFNRYSKWIGINYTAFLEKEKPYKTTSYKRRLEVTADMTSGGKPFGMENADRLYDLIKRSKLVIDTQRQPQGDTAVSDLTLLVERVPFLDATAYTKAGRLTFTIPVLMPERYFSADLTRIDEVYDKFNLPIRPKRLVNAADIAETLEFGDPEFNESVRKLGTIFMEQIGGNSVHYGTVREMAITGKVVKGTEVLVSLNAPAATKLIGGLFQTAASQDTLLAYTYGNLADISTMLDDAGIFRLSEYLDQTGTVLLNEKEKRIAGMLNFRNNTEAFRNSLKAAFDGYSIQKELQMAVFIDKNGTILDRRITFDLAGKDGSQPAAVEIHTSCSNTEFEDFRNRSVEIRLTKAGTETRLSFFPSFQKGKGADTSEKIALNYEVIPENGVKSGTDVELDLSGVTDPGTLKRNEITTFRIKIYGSDGEGSVTGDLNTVRWKNKKLNATSYTTKIIVKADLPTFGIKDLSAVVNLAGEDRLGIGTVPLPEVQPDRITDLNAVSGADLKRIEMEAGASFGTFYLTNKPIFDVIMGKKQ